jgi:hypothetical protein
MNIIFGIIADFSDFAVGRMALLITKENVGFKTG